METMILSLSLFFNSLRISLTRSASPHLRCRHLSVWPVAVFFVSFYAIMSPRISVSCLVFRPSFSLSFVGLSFLSVSLVYLIFHLDFFSPCSVNKIWTRHKFHFVDPSLELYICAWFSFYICMILCGGNVQGVMLCSSSYLCKLVFQPRPSNDQRSLAKQRNWRKMQTEERMVLTLILRQVDTFPLLVFANSRNAMKTNQLPLEFYNRKH